MKSLVPYGSLKRCTPLKTLELERCHISYWPAFETLLTLPRALRSLTMRMTSTRKDESEDILKALRQQADALQYLCFAQINDTFYPWEDNDLHAWTRHYRTLKSSHIISTGLSGFTLLESLDVDYRSNLTHTLFHAHWKPPNLRTLGVVGLKIDWPGLDIFAAGIASAASFTTLVLHLAHPRYPLYRNRWAHDKDFATAERRNTTSTIADMLKEKGRSLKVVCVHDEQRFVQPYRFNEILPSIEVIFNSEEDRREGDEFFICKQKHVPERYAAALPYAYHG